MIRRFTSKLKGYIQVYCCGCGCEETKQNNGRIVVVRQRQKSEREFFFNFFTTKVLKLWHVLSRIFETIEFLFHIYATNHY